MYIFGLYGIYEYRIRVYVNADKYESAKDWKISTNGDYH